MEAVNPKHPADPTSPGEICKAHGDDTYDVAFHGGDFASRIQRGNIYTRAISPPTSNSAVNSNNSNSAPAATNKPVSGTAVPTTAEGPSDGDGASRLEEGVKIEARYGGHYFLSDSVLLFCMLLRT